MRMMESSTRRAERIASRNRVPCQQHGDDHAAADKHRLISVFIFFNFGIVCEYFFQQHVKGKRNAESQFQGWGVLFLFEGDDRLARNTDLLSQSLLGQFAVEKT
jgi:hypothetical protein